MSTDDHSLIIDPSSSAGLSDSKKPGKIFVGGLTWDTTVDDLKNYFKRYGNILDATIVKDPISGRSRGFGFVVFEDSAILKQVFSADSHFINGKKVDTKNAFRRNVEQACRKIFVGGVDPQLSENEIRNYFSSFGPIDEIDFPWDKDKNQRRAFCFVAFQSADVVDEILKQSKHKLGERMVDVKKATPKQDNNSLNASNNLALSILSQALNMNNGGNSASQSALLANLLGTGQSQTYSNAFGGLAPNAIIPALSNITSYPSAMQAGPQGPVTPVNASVQAAPNHSVAAANSNPYMALAAAAAAAGLIPPAAPTSAPAVDLTSWYSQLALVAAMASQDGSHLGNGPIGPIGSPAAAAVMQQSPHHRDNSMLHQPLSNSIHHPSASNNMLSMTPNHHSAGGSYNKPNRSGGPLSTGGGGGGSGTGAHRGNVQYHPYSR